MKLKDKITLNKRSRYKRAYSVWFYIYIKSRNRKANLQWLKSDKWLPLGVGDWLEGGNPKETWGFWKCSVSCLDGGYMNVYRCQNLPNWTYKIYAFYCIKLHLNITDFSLTKKTQWPLKTWSNLLNVLSTSPSRPQTLDHMLQEGSSHICFVIYYIPGT